MHLDGNCTKCLEVGIIFLFINDQRDKKENWTPCQSFITFDNLHRMKKKVGLKKIPEIKRKD